MKEMHSTEEILAKLNAGKQLQHFVFQGIFLTSIESTLANVANSNILFLGCDMSP
jgi:hypothetical protein